MEIQVTYMMQTINGKYNKEGNVHYIKCVDDVPISKRELLTPQQNLLAKSHDIRSMIIFSICLRQSRFEFIRQLRRPSWHIKRLFAIFSRDRTNCKWTKVQIIWLDIHLIFVVIAIRLVCRLFRSRKDTGE